jgi:hypothetical protein
MNRSIGEGRHQTQIFEEGGSWQSAIIIALKSMKKSLSERINLGKS